MEFWDGINNTGNGTHDPNATMWKSLVSGGQDLTIDAGIWTDGNCLSNDALRAAYKLLCHDGLNVSDAIAAIERDVPDLPEVREVVEFFRTTKRGVIR